MNVVLNADIFIQVLCFHHCGTTYFLIVFKYINIGYIYVDMYPNYNTVDIVGLGKWESSQLVTTNLHCYSHNIAFYIVLASYKEPV